MAKQPRLSSGLGQVLPKSVIDQLVPKNKTLGDLINFYGQGLLGEGKGAKTFIPPVKNMEQMYGKPDTKGGEALNFLMDIPLAGLEAGRLFTGGISALTNPAGNIFGDYLNQPSEKRRKEIAQNIATGTGGIEIGLPIDKSRPLGGIGADPKIGQTLKELAKTEKRDAGEFASIESDAGEATKRSTMDLPGEFEAEQAAIEQAKKGSTQLGDMSQEGAEMEIITPEMREPVISEEEKKTQAQQSLFKEAMDDINNIYGDDTKTDKTRKTLEDYKADFAKATGIDVSGEPDNKLALMSLGLSLMQNRAGKGFNLSNIIGAAGEAGQKAMPLFEKAKADARAGQVAAGKYALGETKADSLAALATAKEKRKALAALSTQFRDEKFKRQLEYIKHNNNMQIKLLENNMKPIDAKGKVTTQTLEGNNFLKVDTAFVTGSRNRVFLAPVQQAEKHANMYVNVLEAGGSIDEMQNILKSVGEEGGSTAFTLLGARVKKFLKPLGIGDTDYSKGIDEIVKKDISAEEKVTAIQQRLISQYKKFLTKETGNGVSEGDIKRLEALMAKIDLTQPLSSNINRLEELRTIFDAPKRALESQFNSFSKRENFRNDEEYNKTMAIVNKAISTGTDDLYSSNFVDGVFTIDLRKK
jgi:hypothetical protein